MDRFDGGRGGFDGNGGLMFLPVLALLLMAALLMAALVATYLVRSGKLSLAGVRRTGPEEEAKHVLADRFARGDISSDEFLERSSMLGWTPGSDALPRPSRRRVR
jgi:putative membrane protein